MRARGSAPGTCGGRYVTLRPIVWGGQEKNAPHAFTLRGTYTYMEYGHDLLDFCLGVGVLQVIVPRYYEKDGTDISGTVALRRLTSSTRELHSIPLLVPPRANVRPNAR